MNRTRLTLILIIPVPPVPVPTNPCVPSPCGANAICREAYGSSMCSCAPEFYGNPYEGCRPECVIDTDCTANQACLRSKCQNPCLGTCGQNAICQVINHVPSCSCERGFMGDPFRFCRTALQTRKNPIKLFCYKVIWFS